MSISKLLELIEHNKERPLVSLIAPQVLVSLSMKYSLTPELIFHILADFLKQKLKATLVLDLWEGIQLGHQLGYQ